MSHSPIVILGAGLAGSSCARELHAAGAEVLLIETLPEATYELPPLSKTLFAEALSTVPLTGEPHGLDYTAGTVTRVDTAAHTATLADGRRIAYSQLVIATGMSARTYPGQLPGGAAFTVHSVAEAQAVRAAVAAQGGSVDLGILGSGYLALELARGAVEAGHRATVYLRKERPLSALSDELATAIMRLHQDAGVAFVPASQPEDYRPHELWLTAIGAHANTNFLPTELPRTARGALHVDEYLRVLPDVFAIGDAARITAGPMASCGRLESEPMAASQGTWLGQHIAGAMPEAWSDIPWHWSFQGPVRVFTAGHSAQAAAGAPLVLGDPATGAFQVALFDGDMPESRLIGVETVGKPPLHNAAKKVLASSQVPTRAEVTGDEFDMRGRARGQ